MVSLSTRAQQIAEEFEVSDSKINELVQYFIQEAEECLAEKRERGLPMIPTFVTGVPDGTEKGTFLAVDLGGTNLRVCSVCLKGDSTFDLIQEKVAVPQSIMKGDSADFFGFMADRVGEFLEKHHGSESLYAKEQSSDALKTNPSTPNLYKLGFTFSFPVDQSALNRGKLMRWTKGFDIKDAVGKDVCAEFQSALNIRQLPVYVAALVNDTVGTLMARSYTKPSAGRTLIGCIFGTGTNGAYSEKISKIGKFDKDGHPEIVSKIMVINTEWGSFDNDVKHLPNTRFDVVLNTHTPNPNYHMFEKRVSGLYLGELLRLVLLELQGEKLIFNKPCADSSALYTPWSIDTSVPSLIDADKTSDLSETESIVLKVFGQETTLEQRQAIQLIAKAIGKRSARLSAVPLAGIIIKTKALTKFEGEIDIGADGSVVEFYPGFEKNIREAFRATPIGAEESRISIGIAKDGSGVGAALCALVAE